MPNNAARVARDVRRIIAIAYLFVFVAATALTACARLSPQRAASGSRNAWTVHGVLRIVDTRQPDNLNPLLSFGQVATDLSMFWAAYLFRWDDRGELVPELATDVPTQGNGGISKDGLTLVYHLRKGVRWQDGAQFSADDVIFTWQQVMNPRNNVQSRMGYDTISSIERLSDATIRIHLKRPFSPFVETFFTMADATYCILPRHLLSSFAEINRAAYNNLPIGTGPFRIVEDQKNTEIRMLANPSYWRGPPHLREIIFRIVPDDNTILTQFRAHEADFRMLAPITQAVTLEQSPELKVYEIPFTSFEYLGFNTEHAPLHDMRVRQALRYATNIDKLATALARGRVIRAGADQPPFLWAFNSHVKTMGTIRPSPRRCWIKRAGKWQLTVTATRKDNVSSFSSSARSARR